MAGDRAPRDSVAAVLARYAGAAAAHGRATLDKNISYREVNKQYRILAKALEQLRCRGPDAQLALLGLLDDPDPSVRGWAARDALEFAPQQAEACLAELAKLPGLIGFDAEMVLKEWRAGRLRP